MHSCEMTAIDTGPARLAACSTCSRYEWSDRDGSQLDPSDAIAAVYGPFPLIQRLESIGTPGGSALVYRVPRRYQTRLDVLVIGEWTRIHPDLYASQDGINLLLAPTDPTVSRRFATAG